MDTKQFRTRQEMNYKTNPKCRDYIIGLDVGYSSSKVFYENGYLVFPSYIKEIESVLSPVSDKDIYYRDSDGKIYLIGYNAQELVQSDDTNDTDGELFSRKRYKDKRFQIICNTALALATRNKKDSRKIVIQSGLPSSYMKGDSKALKNVLSTKSRFELKIGKNHWQEFDLSINPQDIYIMEQPKGALFSALTMDDGNETPDALNVLINNVLVMDIGFGTFDFYGLIGRSVACSESIDTIGMREVLTEAIKQIMNETGEDIRIAAFQRCLDSGKFVFINEDDLSSEEKPLAPILDAANKKVMKTALERAKSVTKSFRDYRYIIIDGGTGEAWYKDICEYLKNLKTIQIWPSNRNDHLPCIYSNARGYYMYRYRRTRK